MSMDVGGAKGGVKSDINVTPLVDVMLVLLIIMMVIAPLLNSGVPLTLPLFAHSDDKPDTSDQMVLAVDSQGGFYINSLQVPRDDVIPKLLGIVQDKGPGVVYVKADVDAPYGAVMEMMDAVRKAKIDTVALITERPHTGEGGK